jgi:hypothetical protein
MGFRRQKQVPASRRPHLNRKKGAAQRKISSAIRNVRQSGFHSGRGYFWRMTIGMTGAALFTFLLAHYVAKRIHKVPIESIPTVSNPHPIVEVNPREIIHFIENTPSVRDLEVGWQVIGTNPLRVQRTDETREKTQTKMYNSAHTDFHTHPIAGSPHPKYITDRLVRQPSFTDTYNALIVNLLNIGTF